MRPRALVSLAAVAALLLSARRASAEEDPGPRLHLGFAIRGGPLIVPGVGAIGIFSAEPQAGVQFNNFVGLYALADWDVPVGKLAMGFHIFEALLVEFTLGNRLFVAVGPQMGWYDVSVSFEGTPPTRSGYMYGGRFHIAWDLIALRADRSQWSWWQGPRAALTVGLDLSLLGGVARYLGAVDKARNATANPLSFLPMVTIGLALF